MRHVRRLQWHSRYYILPAYRRLLERHGWHRTRWMEFGPDSKQHHSLLRNGLVAVLVGVILIAGIANLASSHTGSPAKPAVQGAATPPAHPVTSAHSQDTSPAPSAQPSGDPAADKPLVFGLGAQADGAMRQRIYDQAPIGMVTSWFNSPADLKFMASWRNTTVQQAYVNGKAMHLVVWTGGEEKPLRTAYGPACGREYPFSASFETDMRQLAEIFAGRADGPPLYVSMFTEFQTYPCQDNNWRGSENYYRGLQEQYRKASDIFKATAPNSQVSLTWGGWQADWNDPAKGGGQALIPHFADVMNASDFQSFQAMDSRSNVRHVADMTRILGTYGPNGGKRVMVAHFKPDNGNQTTWSNDLATIFTAPTLAQLKQNGLFAFSFMDEKNINASEQSYNQARGVIQQFAR